MQWKCHAITDQGKVRKLNEDSIFHNDNQQIWAVADGMGGHHRGDLASQTIVKYLNDYQPSRHNGISLQQLTSLLQQANAELVEKASAQENSIIASTCAILSRSRHSVICSWVGDSRIYRFRNNELSRLTRDHSYQSLIDDLRDKGENIENIMVNGETLTRGVGAEPELVVEHCHFPVQTGDRFLICTDGLYKEISDSELHQYFSSDSSDESLLSTLHQDYLNAGARDNLGLILVTAS